LSLRLDEWQCDFKGRTLVDFALHFDPAAVFVAELTHAPQSRIDQLAGIFVLLRVIYTAFYVADQATLRSVVWSLGFIAVLWLFVLGV